MRIGVGRRVGPVYVWMSRGVRVSGTWGPVWRAVGAVLAAMAAVGMLIGGARVVGGGSFDGRSADEISMEQLGLSNPPPSQSVIDADHNCSQHGQTWNADLVMCVYPDLPWSHE